MIGLGNRAHSQGKLCMMGSRQNYKMLGEYLSRGKSERQDEQEGFLLSGWRWRGQ
jgi:hypothetical protein